MSRALLSTRLKVSDPTAMTALATLRDRFGFGPRLAALAREELFLFDTPAEPAATRETIEELVRKTNLFMNPNKHHWRLVVDGEPAAAPVAPAIPAPGFDAAAEVALLVWTPGDGQDLLESARRHAGTGDLERLARGWLWRLTGGPGVGADELLAMAERAAELRSLQQGLLVHPAYQDHRLYATRPALYDIASDMTFEADDRQHQESRS